MKRIFFLLVAVTTFFLGCALSWLNLSHPKSLNIITPTVGKHGEIKVLLDGIKPTARGCGNGYVQAYELPDGKKLGEGNMCFSSYREASTEMESWLKKADHIIERVAPAKQKDKLKSERVVAAFLEDEYGNTRIRIMWVQGHCIHSLHAPDLEYALELERSKFNPYKFEE
jgi:hypothetical protein